MSSGKVLERKGVSQGLTLDLRREEGGKIRVRSSLWENAKVIGKNEVPEVRNADGRLRIVRKEQHHDEWDPFVEPCDPYGPGAFVTRNGSDEAIDD